MKAERRAFIFSCLCFSVSQSIITTFPYLEEITIFDRGTHEVILLQPCLMSLKHFLSPSRNALTCSVHDNNKVSVLSLSYPRHELKYLYN